MPEDKNASAVRKVKERSAGAVVFHIGADGKREYLLLRYGAGHWGFPKGHVEAGESDLEAAQRETVEETGIDASAQKILPGFEALTDYYFRRGTTIVEKEVRFFLCESATRDVRVSHEHTGYVWLPYEEALAQTSFEGPKRVIRDAHAFLSGEKR